MTKPSNGSAPTPSRWCAVDRCTSVSTTRARVQQAAAWLAQSREDRTLVERAAQRAKIVKTMAE